MTQTDPVGRSNPSWSTETSSRNQVGPSRLGRILERLDWVELVFTVLALAAYDLITFLLGGFAIAEARCPAGQCGPGSPQAVPLPVQIQQLHDTYWVLPVLFALPLLVGLLLRRRWLLLIAALQVAACGLLLLHISDKASVLDDRLHGRVPCWNAAYTPTTCPWDSHS